MIIKGFTPPKGEKPFFLERVIAYEVPEIPNFTVPVMVRRFKRRTKAILLAFPSLPMSMTTKSYLMNELKYSEDHANEILEIQETSEDMLTAIPNSGTLSFGTMSHQFFNSSTVYEDPNSREARILLNAIKALGFNYVTVNRIHPGNKAERIERRDRQAKKARES